MSYKLTSNSMNNNEVSASSSEKGATPSVSVSKTESSVSAQNVQFTDGDSPWAYQIITQRDETFNFGGHSDANLGDFLSRPILIATYQWTPSAQLFQKFNPWQLYFSNLKVLQKLNYFHNFRCNLCLKVMLNGNAFYYGRALLSYNPYLVNDDITRDRAFFIQDLVEASQRPHVLLDPCSSQGAEMTLPFIWPYNWFDITTPNWDADIGECTIHDFYVLQHANGGTDPITVNIFAWAEDVELCIPTSLVAQATLATQTCEVDKHGFPMVSQAKTKKGPPKKSSPKQRSNNMASSSELSQTNGLISKPASAIAAAASALSMIPMIAPYATATSMVATKIGQVAKIFGYSRPQICDDIQKATLRYMGNLSNTDAPEQVNKLSVDSKNELTIDSRVVGMNGKDELTIKSIIERESYIQQFDWPESAVQGSMLMSMKVDPTWCTRLVAAPVTELHLTPLSFASVPFRWWKGSIKYRFMIVASEYHRGRLRLVYDPNKLSDLDFNATYSTIIDLADTRDFEYEVQWTRCEGWAQVRTPDSMRNAAYFSTFATVNPDVFSNGTLSIYVLNELATPSTTNADVKVLVWISGGDDFSLAQPTCQESIQRLSIYQQQSEMSEVMVTSSDTSNSPDSTVAKPSFGSPNTGQESTYLVYMGEQIVSFRDLLKRYHWSETINILGGGAGQIGLRTWYKIDFPPYRGWDPNGPHSATNSAAGPSPFNFCGNTLMNYLTPAFVMRRGAIRRKYLQSRASESNRRWFSVTRLDKKFETSTGHTNFSPAGAGSGRISRAFIDARATTGSGAAVTSIDVQPVLEIELPYYSDTRFEPARDIRQYVSREQYAHALQTVVINDALLVDTVMSYVAAGEDFQLSFFIATPIMFYVVEPGAL